ncbi:1-phosphofructokinase [Metapseudomonas resinovorans]|uniref:Phosphofructokinase n=1 Tax=Metapseudomonas resinovorans NBRC 106553 TaxID=1245471 RepID=S6AGT9_METRE|nr:1-phosphofructokinase [Pseudomonas resinovorans]BAN47385.1 1-phosphofructokinase [Pseudomonas resinovorans NBRC 106553]
MARILTLTLNPALDLTLHLERLEPSAVNRSLAQVSHAAGKGLNVAQVLADLGHQLTVSGFLGADNADAFEALFARRGFTDAFVRVAGETRSNIKLAEADGRITDINGPGPLVDAMAQVDLLMRLETLAPGHDLAVVAGSLPRGVEPYFLTDLITRLQGHGLKVALDTSGEALRAGLLATPWLIKPNVDELADICERDLASVEAQREEARQLRAMGIEHIVISQGADGVNWFGPGFALHGQPPRVSVASTVGAGDSLLAGMVHGLLNGWSAARTLRLATAIAAQAVTQVGFGIQDAAQLQELEGAVDVQALPEQQEVSR